MEPFGDPTAARDVSLLPVQHPPRKEPMSGIITWNAQYLEGEGLWEVRHGDRWWTAAQLPDGSWHIANEQLREVAKDGRLARNIIAVIEARDLVDNPPV